MKLKKVVVIGGAGYIGAHFLNRLEGYDATVLDNFSQGKNNVIKYQNIEYRKADIRDRGRLIRIFKDIQPDIVVHYAALANVPNSIADPGNYYNTNITGSINVLDAMLWSGCGRIIFSSSAAVYGESSERITEDHPKNPTNPYGYTKLVVEQILKDYHRAYGINSISFRYFCATGCDESLKVGCYHNPETQVIPNIVKTLLGQQEVFNVWGDTFDTPDGTGVRDYIHVNDLADAHILALDKLDVPICEVYNLGMNKGFSVMELIKEAEEVTGKELNYQIKPARPGDPPSLIADASKAKRDLGWEAQYTDIGKIIMTDYKFFESLINKER